MKLFEISSRKMAEFWDNEFWDIEITKFWGIEITKFWDIEIFEFRYTKVQMSRHQFSRYRFSKNQISRGRVENKLFNSPVIVSKFPFLFRVQKNKRYAKYSTSIFYSKFIDFLVEISMIEFRGNESIEFLRCISCVHKYIYIFFYFLVFCFSMYWMLNFLSKIQT